MGEFSPPFFLSFLFFFLIPRTRQPGFGSITFIITKIHPPFQNPRSAPDATLTYCYHLLAARFPALASKLEIVDCSHLLNSEHRRKLSLN